MYQAELSIIVKAMREAYLAHGSFSRVNDKAPFDQVTDADVAIEAFLLQRIREHFPKDAILSEETLSLTGIQGRTWTVDPIDGTANFAKGFPLFGIQCALFEGGIPVMSAIWLPAFDECYTAVRGEGAYCNGERLTVLPCDPQRALVSFGDYPHSRPEDFADQHRMVYRLSSQVGRIRMFGSAAVDFASLASGAINATVLFTKNQWDLAPGILLASEAGAVITDPQGLPYTLESRGVIAAADKATANLIKACF